MQQQVTINQPADQVLKVAGAFFVKRRAKVTDRDDQGFRFGLEGGDQGESGRVTVAPTGGGSTVTVEANALGLMAIADGFVRELRKQARDAGRQGRSVTGTAARVELGDLRQRLGMPEPVLRPRPQPAGAVPGGASPQGGPRPGASTRPPALRPEVGAADANVPVAAAGARPDGPAPQEAPGVSTAAPRVSAETLPEDHATDATDADVPVAAAGARPDGPAPQEAPGVSAETGPRSTVTSGETPPTSPHPDSSGPTAASAEAAPEAPATPSGAASVPPSAEQIGGTGVTGDSAEAGADGASGAVGEASEAAAASQAD